MGREVRRVPEGWSHPRANTGHYIPLHDHFGESFSRWSRDHDLFLQGKNDDGEPLPPDVGSEEDWHGSAPDRRQYMPDWPEAYRTHFQMYETCSEGTPISPVMETPEALARWLADTGASAFADMTASYDQWLATIRAGWAPSAVFTNETGLVSGVVGQSMQAGVRDAMRGA